MSESNNTTTHHHHAPQPEPLPGRVWGMFAAAMGAVALIFSMSGYFIIANAQEEADFMHDKLSSVLGVWRERTYWIVQYESEEMIELCTIGDPMINDETSELCASVTKWYHEGGRVTNTAKVTPEYLKKLIKINTAQRSELQQLRAQLNRINRLDSTSPSQCRKICQSGRPGLMQ